MYSQKFPQLEQGTPKILSKTTFKFDIRSYKTSEDLGMKQQGQSVQTKRQKTQPSLKQMPVFKKLVQKKLFNSLVNPNQQFEIPCNWEQKYQDKVKQLIMQIEEKECSELQEKNQEQQKTIEQLERKFLSLKLAYESLQEEQQDDDVLNIKKQMNLLESELKDQLHRTEQQLWKTQEQNFSIQDKFKQFELKAKFLKQQTVKEIQHQIHLHQELLCKYCGKLVNDAVTIIPCAHTYCGTCNKGYQTKCFLCGDEGKIEATYYNQFMSEIVKMYDTFQTIVQIFLG
ncbi:unnamed protein product [Paramecium primaurelia]|uniref:RING-type domain-containing protein n=1 Tax=Paramecium primaurelia TaxID=5886 RepID=A0A8S1KKR5_PARPR|nr:unnamed protein product [Paramecium primaurelia]